MILSQTMSVPTSVCCTKTSDASQGCRFRFVSLFPLKWGQQLCVWYVMFSWSLLTLILVGFSACISVASSGNLKRPETGFYPTLQLKIKTRARLSPEKTSNEQKQFEFFHLRRNHFFEINQHAWQTSRRSSFSAWLWIIQGAALGVYDVWNLLADEVYNMSMVWLPFHILASKMAVLAQLSLKSVGD